MRDDVAFLLDCDNTLLDNDVIQDDLRRHLTSEFGRDSCDRYWTIFERLRSELGYADYLGALQRYRFEMPGDPSLLLMSSFLLDYPFDNRLYPHALDVLAHLGRWGRTVILTDGDVVFQPRKVRRSGLWDAVEGRVMITLHKEQVLEMIAGRYPARHYVLVDDKLRLLTAFKEQWGSRVTTVFPRQGHYARDPDILAAFPAADLTIERIGELLHHDLPTLRGGPGRGGRPGSEP